MTPGGVAERGAHRGDALVGGQVGGHARGLAGAQVAAGLVERVGVGVDQHDAAQLRLAQRVGGGDAGPAAEVGPGGSGPDQGRGDRVAQVVLDADRGLGVARDALLPVGHGAVERTLRPR